ncbi:MAG: hypothetical protein B6241_06255 [Spirochaetaceae bacterium 4572_59]|nr:MAG: hypothetical protein B6241_06255 [Spirochaetaceae bacterium 4572_59]
MAGFIILIATVGLLYIAGGIESIRSNWFIASVKWILFPGFFYEVVQDASQLDRKSFREHYSLKSQELMREHWLPSLAVLNCPTAAL